MQSCFRENWLKSAWPKCCNKSKYPFLKKYQREDKLKKVIIQKIINDFPKLAPRQIFDIINKISENHFVINF